LHECWRVNQSKIIEVSNMNIIQNGITSAVEHAFRRRFKDFPEDHKIIAKPLSANPGRPGKKGELFILEKLGSL